MKKVIILAVVLALLSALLQIKEYTTHRRHQAFLEERPPDLVTTDGRECWVAGLLDGFRCFEVEKP